MMRNKEEGGKEIALVISQSLKMVRHNLPLIFRSQSHVFQHKNAQNAQSTTYRTKKHKNTFKSKSR